MLSNAYFLAKVRFDTAENEPAKNLQILQNLPILLTLTPPNRRKRPGRGAPGGDEEAGAPDHVPQSPLAGVAI